MTVAVCLKCGSIKWGAWTQCSACNHVPQDTEDRAKHLYLTDHYHSRTELEQFAEAIKSGQAVSFPPDLLESFAGAVSAHKESWANVRKWAKGIALAFVFLVVIALLLARACSGLG